ncbi:hypothetical protein LINGRAHAP2_LOCUS19678, partial [Linum grandiflorum]
RLSETKGRKGRGPRPSELPAASTKQRKIREKVKDKHCIFT